MLSEAKHLNPDGKEILGRNVLEPACCIRACVNPRTREPLNS